MMDERRSQQERRKTNRYIIRAMSAALLASLLAASVFGYGYIHSASQAKKAADKANVAAEKANENTDRIDRIQKGFCSSLRFAQDAENRTGAIIFVVLGQVVKNSKIAGNKSNAAGYEKLQALTRFQQTIDCRMVLTNSNGKEPSESVPFTKISSAQLKQILGDK